MIQAVVEMKRRNPSWGCPQIAEQISLAFGTLSGMDGQDKTAGIQVLAQIRSMFEQHRTDRVSNETIVGALKQLEYSASPGPLLWTKAQLARRLATFGIAKSTDKSLFAPEPLRPSRLT